MVHVGVGCSSKCTHRCVVVGRFLQVKRHLAADGGVARTSLVLNSYNKNKPLIYHTFSHLCSLTSCVYFLPTIFVHATVNASLEAARATLVPVCLVHRATLILRLANVLTVASNRTLEEASAPAGKKTTDVTVVLIIWTSIRVSRCVGSG